MFGMGRKDQTFEVLPEDPAKRSIIVIADSEKKAMKKLPREYYEDIKRGKCKITKLS